MTPSRSGKILALLLTLAPLAHSVRAADGFDGSYVGTRLRTQNDNRGKCQNIDRNHIRLVVKNGVIKYRWGVLLEATVGDDGSFATHAQGTAYGKAGPLPDRVDFKGTISAGKLEADVGGPRCGAHLSLRKS